MKTNPGADVFAILRSLRRRLIVREFLDALAACALISGASLVAVEAVMRFLRMPPLITVEVFAAAVACVVLVAAVIVLARRRSLECVAAFADRRGGTKDRLITALALSRAPAGEVAALARAECETFLARADFRPLIPLHPPRVGVWLVVPLVAIALLRLDFAVHRAAARTTAGQAQAAVADTVAQIEQLARKVQQAHERTKDEELKKLADQLQRSAERLRAEAKPGDAQKSALRELSALEEMMRDIQRQPSPADEMKELAKALAPMPGMKDVLKALNENNLAEAQRALERAKQSPQPGADQATEEQVEKALSEAVQNLADRRRLSQALQNLAEQMQQRGGQSPSQQAMQQLAQMLQQAQRGGQPGDSSSQRQMTMQELISALENMKFGDGESQNPQNPGGQKTGDGQQLTIQNFSAGNPNAQPQPGDAQSPGGKPGSDRDLGTSVTPFGEKGSAQDKGGELALKGQLGQGETLSMMLPGAADQSRAARRYKDLYDAAAAAAQDSVQQENIPLGSRFLIKRYFESIRPQE
ncbi:MAG: hypothetical protein ABMA13_09110 [Chthoniobacteraceae bacterium]